MAFGIGKAFKKGWKSTFGKVEDAVKPYAPIIAGAALGALTGGMGFAAAGIGSGVFGSLGAAGSSFATGAIAGGSVGALSGGAQYVSARQQEKSIKAQIASAEKIAAMQNNTVVSAAPIPTQTVQQAVISEQNEATRKARAFRLSSSVRNSTLGGGMGGRKKVLG